MECLADPIMHGKLHPQKGRGYVRVIKQVECHLRTASKLATYKKWNGYVGMQLAIATTSLCNPQARDTQYVAMLQDHYYVRDLFEA